MMFMRARTGRASCLMFRQILNTRVVVPLMSVDAAPAPAKQLNPVFDIRSEWYVMVAQFLSAVPVSILKTPVVSLAKHDREIDGALDMLLTGV